MWHRIRSMAMAIMVVFILTGDMGCGKKGPPLPPLALVPPAPMALTWQLAADQVILQWKLVPEFQKKAGTSDMGVEIYKATRELTKDMCRDCPLTFKKSAELSATTLRYAASLERGYQYFYRLRIRQGDAVFSEYSETVSFDFE